MGKHVKKINELVVSYLLFVGKTVDVLFEKYEKGINKGHCSQYLNVELACEIDLTNQFVKVEVISVKESTLIARLK